MNVINANWKSNLLCQLKEHNQQRNGYHHIIERYNRLSENNAILKTQCIRLGKDVDQLRLSNADLVKTSGASQELGNEEILMHLREKVELGREVFRLNRALTDVNEKFIKEELKAEQYKTENDQLHEQIKKTEFELNHLSETNQDIREEFQALESKLNQLQIVYNQMKPSCVKLEQELDIAKRMNEKLENELISCKNRLAENYDYENARFNEKQKKFGRKIETPRTVSEPSIFIDDDMVIISSVIPSADSHSNTLFNSSGVHDNFYDSMHSSSAESYNPLRRGTLTPGNKFTSFMRRMTSGPTNSTYDKLNRTSTYCFSASIPRREVNQWDCTEMQVYALQFQPSGSILATGCSDKMVHLWEISSMGQQHKYCSLEGSHGAINALDFDNEGCRFLVGCSGDKAYLWSYGECRNLKDIYTGHKDLITTCKFISGTKFATGSADRSIKRWDLSSRQCIQTLLTGSKCHDLVVIDAAGTIISGHFDKNIRIWDPRADKCRPEVVLDASITSLSYNNDKQQLLACLKDDTLRLIDLRQNKTLCTFSHDHFKVSTDTTRAILSPDGHYACAGSHDGSVIVWNTETRHCENVLQQTHTTRITSVAWQPDGRYVASCEKHRRVILWSD